MENKRWKWVRMIKNIKVEIWIKVIEGYKMKNEICET